MDASTAAIAMGDTGTIPPSAYTCISHSSLIGPQGIAVQPLFDRDGDKISDLIEATNQGTGTLDLRPTIKETPDSHPTGTPSQNGVKALGDVAQILFTSKFPRP